MDGELLRLYPLPSTPCPCAGLYLGQNLRECAAQRSPFIYTNFITSLDGRIAAPAPDSRRWQVPEPLTNAFDQRLYQELAAQADCLLTTGRHLRAAAAGRQQDLLTLTDADLVAWRQARGLPAQPVIAAVSACLEIPVGRLGEQGLTPSLVITNADAESPAYKALTRAGITVGQLPRGAGLSGDGVAAALAGMGYGVVYSVAGPRVFHALAAADQVSRLYLTWAQLLLAGETFETLTHGDRLDPPPGFQLHSLYADFHHPAKAGQLFTCLVRQPVQTAKP